jgi:hypothetical protein
MTLSVQNAGSVEQHDSGRLTPLPREHHPGFGRGQDRDQRIADPERQLTETKGSVAALQKTGRPRLGRQMASWQNRHYLQISVDDMKNEGYASYLARFEGSADEYGARREAESGQGPAAPADSPFRIQC